MSHFTTIAAKINSLPALAAAAAALGRPFAQGNLQARGWQGNRMAAKATIDMGQYDIAVVPEEGATEESYTLVADWWAIAATLRRSQAEITDELTREYSLARVCESCAAEGYEIDRNQIQIAADGSMSLVAEKWGE